MPDLTGQTVGFIGLGLMGKPMARNLGGAGATVVIHNRSRGPVDELAGEGMVAANSPADVARKAESVVIMVADTAAVEHVLFGPGGVAEGVGPGSLVIDMGTTAVDKTREFAARLADGGADFVDAPVSGGQIGAKEATLTIMAGGSDEAVERARPFFAVMGKRLTHVGGVGAGQVAKAANQVIVGLTIGAVAEALALAKSAGVDPAKVREALVGGFASSRILELHGQRMIDGNFAPGGRSTTQRKDLKQALDLAGQCELDMPATRLTLELYDRLIAEGGADLDHSALFKLYSR